MDPTFDSIQTTIALLGGARLYDSRYNEKYGKHFR